jgi:hypothetical protein
VEPVRQQPKFRRQAWLFGSLAAAAVITSLICVTAELVSVAAPLWKGGPIADTILKVAKQAVLSAPALFYVVGLRANSEGLTAIGWSLLMGALWAIAAAGLEPLAPDQSIDHILHAISYSAADLALAALGLALIMIGRVMNAAATLNAENDGFV